MRMCVTAFDSQSWQSHTVQLQLGEANARCTLGQSRATPQCTPTLLNKQHAELFHTDRVTRI